MDKILSYPAFQKNLVATYVNVNIYIKLNIDFYIIHL